MAEYLTFDWLLGKVFIPLAFIMGVEWEECEVVGHLIGIKTVVNEFIAYRQLGALSLMFVYTDYYVICLIC